MKGRPITGEEFERMLAKVPDVVGEAAATSWTHYLNGLWHSGLRLAESLELHWDRDDKLCVDLSGKRPMLRIPAALEKSNQDRLLPIAPEFAEFLLVTPEAQRVGPVSAHGPSTEAGQPYRDSIGPTVSAIGEKAGVKVNTDAAGKVKCASPRPTPLIRRALGKPCYAPGANGPDAHESIETTMRYYVGRNAQTTAEVLWQAHQTAAVPTVPGQQAVH